MPLPRGPTDILGNRYEGWWNVLQFIRTMNGEAENILIEDPTAHRAEFVLTADCCRVLI